MEGDILYSGAYGNTAWTIDRNGLLEVKGTGNMYDGDVLNEYAGEPEWLQYAKEIKTARIEVTGATSLRGLFDGCENLTSVDLSKLDTSSVTDICLMFCDCESLTSMDLSGFDTSNVEYMWMMFWYCENLKHVNLSSFDTSNVKDMNGLFEGCENLTSVDLSSFDISNTCDVDDVFWDCSNLTTIKTPKKSGETVPDLTQGTWTDSEGQIYTTLPAYATESITLTKE